ncbi:Zinc metalloproteinase [Trichostrongylus colubriformis]|uniref:Zinc metalloproteinase n=1 Tax=Trichostrongylus colubriformis TaxID=6319 RepID=A0AAN8FHF3_TRICO
MHIANLPNLSLLFSLGLLYLPFTSSLRAQRANRKSLAHLKEVLNEDAARLINARQSDAVDLFGDIKRNPNAKHNKDELSVNNPEDYFQGDVDLSEQQVQQIEKSFTEGHREKRKIGRTPLYTLWDRRNAISFDFTETVPRRTREKIREAMNLWQYHTCVRFDEGGPSVDRLEFFDGGGCSSFVGRVGGTQGISIATPGCDVTGIISHEIGHALGIFHEQARPDQDRHIAVNYNNIPISRWNNFQAIGPNHAETFGLPYDTGSVMHYGPYGFASDPYTPTIRTLEHGQQSTIGQRVGPSFLDYQAINAAYGCTDHCPPIKCHHNGYAHPNNCSMCACPDGLGGQFCDSVLPSTGSCGGTLMASTMVQYISSPNYPHPHPQGAECFWILRAASGGRVFLEFMDNFEFYCEDTCDKNYVEVKYHNDKRLTGSRHCCSATPSQRFASFDNEILVIMRAFVGGYSGFRARFWSDVMEPTESTTSLPKFIQTFTDLPETKTTKDVFPLLTTTSTETVTESTHTITTTTTKRPSTRPTPARTMASRWERLRTTTPSPASTESVPIFTLFPTTTKHSLITHTPVTFTTRPDTKEAPTDHGQGCNCGDWSEWVGECSQQCGGCGHRVRTRQCLKTDCRNEDKRACNFAVCPTGTNFLINNGEFHILWRGCCVGLFRSGNECTALETEQNPFLKIISSLLNIHDAKQNGTNGPVKIRRGEH